MAKEHSSTEPIQLNNLDFPGIVRVFREVQTTRRPRIIVENDTEVVTVMPVKQKARASRRPHKTGLLTKDDPLFRLIGIGESDGPGDISERKHQYLDPDYQPDTR